MPNHSPQVTGLRDFRVGKTLPSQFGGVVKDHLLNRRNTRSGRRDDKRPSGDRAAARGPSLRLD